jgi:hypothetical protein
MARKPEIALGAQYVLRGIGSVWRIEKILADGIHVALVNVADSSARKTVSAWILGDGRTFAALTAQSVS